MEFNCVQRGHQNMLEYLPVFVGLLLVAGLRFPISAAIAGAIFVVGRVLYFLVRRPPSPLPVPWLMRASGSGVSRGRGVRGFPPLFRKHARDTLQGYCTGDPSGRTRGIMFGVGLVSWGPGGRWARLWACAAQRGKLCAHLARSSCPCAVGADGHGEPLGHRAAAAGAQGVTTSLMHAPSYPTQRCTAARRPG